MQWRGITQSFAMLLFFSVTVNAKHFSFVAALNRIYEFVSVDDFSVGLDLTISMEIRPRSLNGILFSVHGKGDFVVLQLVKGEVRNDYI